MSGATGVADIQSRIASIQSRMAAMLPGGAPSAAAIAPYSMPSADGFAGVLADAQNGGATVAAAPDLTSASDAAGRGVTGDTVVSAAAKYLGVPYRFGGTDPATGLDCSGFVQRTYADLGISLPRVSNDQASAGSAVPSMAEAKPGDLLFFEHGAIDHIGIYVGDGQMINAPHTGAKVRVEKVAETPSAIRRMLPAGTGATPPDQAQLKSMFAAASASSGVPANVLEAVAKVESGENPSAVSASGAAGIMQLMPTTAKSLGVDAMNPAAAIDGAARLLASNMSEFGSLDLALAAYNAGGGAVRRYGGVPPYAETTAYVRKVHEALKGITL